MKIALSKPQARALIKGKGIQLKPAQIGDGKEVPLPEHIMRKVSKAHRLQKGVRVKLTDDEIHGSGFIDWVKENVLAPVGNVAKTVLGNVAAPLLTSVVQKKLGIGMKPKKGGSFKVVGYGDFLGGSFKASGYGAPKLSDSQSLMMGSSHPVMGAQFQPRPMDMSRLLQVSGKGMDVFPERIKQNVVIPDYTSGTGVKRRRGRK